MLAADSILEIGNNAMPSSFFIAMGKAAACGQGTATERPYQGRTSRSF